MNMFLIRFDISKQWLGLTDTNCELVSVIHFTYKRDIRKTLSPSFFLFEAAILTKGITFLCCPERVLWL